jgi:Trk K+ transport system NAD-binding subunit
VNRLFIIKVRAKIILEQFRWALLGVIFLIVLGTFTFFSFYSTTWDEKYHGTIWDSLTATMELLIGQSIFQTPLDSETGNINEVVIRVMYIIFPILGQVFIVYAIFEVAFTIFQYQERQELWFLALSKNMKNHTIIIGIGHVGKRLIEEMDKRGDLNLIGITKEESNSLHDEFIQKYSKKGIPFIFGDGTQTHLLHDANIMSAKTLIAVTHDDMTNYKISIRAKKINPRLRTVLRIFDTEFAERIKLLPEVDETVSTSKVASANFIAKAQMDGILATLKTEVPSPGKTGEDIFQPMVLAKVKIKKLPFVNNKSKADDVLDLERIANATIIAVNGNFHVKEGYPIKLGDELMILGEISEINKIRSELEKIGYPP